jgi:hypothetical protein
VTLTSLIFNINIKCLHKFEANLILCL